VVQPVDDDQIAWDIEPARRKELCLTYEPYNTVVLDDKSLKIHKCWWVPHCGILESGMPHIGHVVLRQLDGVYLDFDLDPPYPPEEVSEEEALNGKGRPCRVCGITYGSYVCDGFPTHAASVVFDKSKVRDSDNT